VCVIDCRLGTTPATGWLRCSSELWRMADSIAQWLTLREPADFASRSVPLTRAVVDAIGRKRQVNILDLGAGTGSNLRYLAEHVAARQNWLLVDRDPVLIAEMPARMSSWAAAHNHQVRMGSDRTVIRLGRTDCSVETRCVDLGDLADPSMFAGRHLVTASALLDLVSEDWLARLALRCRESGAAVLFALTYDGRSRCSPPEPEDDSICALLNEHQRANNKGFGRAAGPDAVDSAARCFAAVGYNVRREPSDWVLTPDMPELQRQLIEGWAEAAIERAPHREAFVKSWLTRRLAHVNAKRSHVTVSHEDLGGLLPEH
jgi:hypothetical protein